MADLSPELAAKIQSLEGLYAGNAGRYFVALAGAWREAGEIGRAEEILRENLKRFPGLSAHVLLGRCLADRGAFQEAANEFHYVLSIDPQNLIVLRTLAEMAAASGRRAEAERWYNELLSVDPMNAEARASLAGLARGGADASVADQPVQVGTGWGGAAEPAPVAGGADADDAEFGMIDLDAPDASSADASGVAAGDDADVDAEWGDLPLDMPDEPRPSATAPAGDFDAFGFGSVDLDAGGVDETGAVGDWLDADARQDLGESAAADRGALAPVPDAGLYDAPRGAGVDDTLLNAPIAGAGLPFLDMGDDEDDPVPADLPLLDDHATRFSGFDAPADADAGFPGFDAPSHADAGFGFGAPADAGLSAFGAGDDSAGLPSFGADEHGDRHDHADHDVDAEVVTETMAELYAAQGLLQQSADVYRELIQQRGEEPALVRRLAEIEARMHPESAVPAEEETPDWLASVDAFAMGGAAASMAAIHMSAEPEPEPEEPADAVYAPAEPADSFYAPEAPADSFYAPADDAEPAGATFKPAGAALESAPAPFGFGGTFDETPVGTSAADGYTDAFADSFEGGFDGMDADTPEPAFAAAPAAVTGGADGDREAWEAPAVRETEPVGFDLIVVEEDGDEVAAPPEVVADMSADWAIAAAPLDDEEEAEAAMPVAAPSFAAPAAGTSSMRAYFAGLLAWQPGQSAAAPAAFEAPSPAALADEAPAGDAAPAAFAGAAPADAAPVSVDVQDGPPADSWLASIGVEDAPWAEAPAAPESTGIDDAPWAETPAAAESTGTDDAPWAQTPAAAESTGTEDAPWAEAPSSSATAEEEPWAEAPAPPAADASAYELPAADAVQPGDEPWAATPEPAPRAGADDDLPLMDLDEPWAAPGAPEPASIDAFTLSDEIAPPARTDEEALPWELPSEPAAAPAPAPAQDAGGGFSFEDFFAGGPSAAEAAPAAVEPEPQPAPETPSPFVPSLAFEPVAEPTPAPAAPAASGPAAGQDDEDEDLESFQAWLQSLKR
jgi:tetratricopeptide (TPR) repeat protein